MALILNGLILKYCWANEALVLPVFARHCKKSLSLLVMVKRVCFFLPRAILSRLLSIDFSFTWLLPCQLRSPAKGQTHRPLRNRKINSFAVVRSIFSVEFRKGKPLNQADMRSWRLDLSEILHRMRMRGNISRVVRCGCPVLKTSEAHLQRHANIRLSQFLTWGSNLRRGR